MGFIAAEAAYRPLRRIALSGGGGKLGDEPPPSSRLLFIKIALICSHADFSGDGATRFKEVEGGLNRMRIDRFESLVKNRAFELDWLRLIPIRGIGLLRWRPFREFGASLVVCRLSRASSIGSEMGKKRAA